MAHISDVIADVPNDGAVCPEPIHLFGQLADSEDQPIAGDYEYDGDDDNAEQEPETVGPAGGMDPPPDPVGETGG